MIHFMQKDRVFILFTAAMVLLLLTARGATAQTATGGGTGASSSVGILLLAHGGSKEWNTSVEAVAAEVGKTQPTEVALGMADRTTMQAGIEKLTARGVTQIVAVPLFVSSHSSVIESTRFLLGLRADAPAELADYAAMDMGHEHGGGHGDGPASSANSAAAGADAGAQDKTKPVVHSVPIKMAPALDRHQILADILADRASAMSKNSAKEEVVLVAHGPNEDEENALWLADLGAVAKLVAAKAPYARVEVATLRDDAEPAVRDAATEKLAKDCVERVQRELARADCAGVVVVWRNRKWNSKAAGWARPCDEPVGNFARPTHRHVDSGFSETIKTHLQ
jgi:CbiX